MSVNRYEFEDYGTNETDGRYVTYEDYAALEQQLAESHRALRAETTAHENTQMQLEKMTAENAGAWIQWPGGEQPVEGSRMVSVIFANETTDTDEASSFGGWHHFGDGADIISYRKLPDYEAEQVLSMRKTIDEKFQCICKLAVENSNLKSKGKEVLNDAFKVFEKINSTINQDAEDLMDDLSLRQFNFLLEHGVQATDTFITELLAKGVDMFGQYHNFSEKLFIQKEAQKFAENIRKGVQS